jgi:hypothetical protein
MIGRAESIRQLQTLGGLSTTIVFRRSIGVAFHSTERFCAGFLSPGAGVGVGSGNAAVFVSAFVPGVTTAVDTFTEGVFESLAGTAMIKGVGGITTDVASAGPATSGTSSAETVGVEPTDAAITTVGDGVDRTSEATSSAGTTATTVSAVNGSINGSVAVNGVGASAGAAAGGVSAGSSFAGSGNGICFRGFSGIGIGVAAGGIDEGAAGVNGVGAGVAGFADGVPAGVVVVPVCGVTEGVPGLTAAPGIAGGVETTGVPDVAGVEAAGAAPGVFADGVVVVAVPDGNGCEFEIAFVF